MSAIIALSLVACGDTTNTSTLVETTISITDELNSEATNNSTSVIEVHEHTFVTVANEDGTHKIKCSDETCTEATTENCTFGEDYVCEVCGYKHEHTFVATSNEDGTHLLQCDVEFCDYSTTENCAFSEDYVCEICGFIHEHTIETTSNGDDTHTLKCTIEGCTYENTETCTLNKDYVCEVCGYKHEHTIVAEANGDGTHNVSCSTCDYKAKKNCKNSNGKCKTCGYTFPVTETPAANGGKYAVTLQGSSSVIKTYGSYDEIFLDVFGMTWAEIQTNWEYRDGMYGGIQYAPYYINSTFDCSVYLIKGVPEGYKSNNVSYWIKSN